MTRVRGWRAGAAGALLAGACTVSPGQPAEPSTGAAAPTVRADPSVTSPSADDAETSTFDTRILSTHVGGGVLWVVRRGEDRQATRLHRFRDGVEVGASDLGSGYVTDAVGDATGLWVATAGPEAVHLDAATGEVDRRVAVDDAESIGLGDGRLVVAGPPAGGADGTAVTVADAGTGEVAWSTRSPDVDWAALVDVGWLDGRPWLAHFELDDTPDDVRGGLVAIDPSGAVVDELDLELGDLVGLGDRLVGTTEPLSARQPEEPGLVVVGPTGADLVTTRLGRDDDLLWAPLVVGDGAAWATVWVDGDGPRAVRVGPDGEVVGAVRLPVPADEGLEQVAIEGADLWFVTAGSETGADGDVPTTLWRLPGAAR